MINILAIRIFSKSFKNINWTAKKKCWLVRMEKFFIKMMEI